VPGVLACDDFASLVGAQGGRIEPPKVAADIHHGSSGLDDCRQMQCRCHRCTPTPTCLRYVAERLRSPVQDIHHRVHDNGATFTAVPGQLEEISRAETLGMLQLVPLFRGLTKRQLVAVAKVVDHLSVGPGAVLVKELDAGTRLIIIRQGTAEVRRKGVVARDGAMEIGHSRRLATVGPGDFVGELSLIDGKPTSASVVAETQLDALVIYRTRFNKLVGSMPQLYPRLLVGMAARIRDLDRRGDVMG